MRKINQDKVPHDLMECVIFIVESLEDNEIEDLAIGKITSSDLHFSLGMHIRNTWSLWDKETHLNQWFRNNLNIGHADDISGIILEAVVAKVSGKQFDYHPSIKAIHEHWKTHGANKFGEKE